MHLSLILCKFTGRLWNKTEVENMNPAYPRKPHWRIIPIQLCIAIIAPRLKSRMPLNINTELTKQWHHNRKERAARAQGLLSNVQASTGKKHHQKGRLWFYPLWRRPRCRRLLRYWRRLLVQLYSSLKLHRYGLAKTVGIVSLELSTRTEFLVYFR